MEEYGEDHPLHSTTIYKPTTAAVHHVYAVAAIQGNRKMKKSIYEIMFSITGDRPMVAMQEKEEAIIS